MSKAKSVNGHDLMLWIGGKVIALSKSCKLQLKANTVDSETKDDGDWEAKEVISRGGTMSNESVHSADKDRANDLVYKDLFHKYIDGEPVEFTFGVAKNANKDGVPEDGWKEANSDFVRGKMLITGLDFDASKGSKAAISVSMETYGKVEYVDGTAE